MNKNIGITIGVLALVAIVGGLYVSKKSNDNAMMVKEQIEQRAMEDKKIADEKMMTAKNVAEEKDTAMKAGSYEAYSLEKVATASADHAVVLFFRASWCPTCISVDKDIKANLSKIPSSLSILDVNYDNSTALKQKYGVIYQHTFVQVDKDGKLIKKWSGSPTLSALVSEVK
jgi:thioredoxin 1